MKKKLLLASLGSVLILATVTALAQSAESASPQTEEGIPIERLVAVMARKTGKLFVLDPRVHANVRLIGRPQSEHTYTEFLGVLGVYGYATVEDEHYVRVIPEPMIRSEAIPNITARDTRPGYELVSEVIAVKNVPAGQLVPLLRPLLPRNAHLAALPASQTLLIADRFENVRRIEALVRPLDVPAPGRAAGDAAAPRSEDGAR